MSAIILSSEGNNADGTGTAVDLSPDGGIRARDEIDPEPIQIPPEVNGKAPNSSLPPHPGVLDQWHSAPRKVRIIHVGAGATGLCAAYKMERQLENYEMVCYEKNSEVGGTWFESKTIEEPSIFEMSY
jgi:hypothetical protein